MIKNGRRDPSIVFKLNKRSDDRRAKSHFRLRGIHPRILDRDLFVAFDPDRIRDILRDSLAFVINQLIHPDMQRPFRFHRDREATHLVPVFEIQRQRHRDLLIIRIDDADRLVARKQAVSSAVPETIGNILDHR